MAVLTIGTPYSAMYNLPLDQLLFMMTQPGFVYSLFLANRFAEADMVTALLNQVGDLGFDG